MASHVNAKSTKVVAVFISGPQMFVPYQLALGIVWKVLGKKGV